MIPGVLFLDDSNKTKILLCNHHTISVTIPYNKLHSAKINIHNSSEIENILWHTICNHKC